MTLLTAREVAAATGWSEYAVRTAALALSGLEPSDVKTLVELVRGYYAAHDLKAKVNDVAGKAECDCAKCVTARPLIGRLPK